MSTAKKLSNITAKQIADKGVQALANRPNASGQYGVGGLSPTQLKLWFDKLVTFIADKINELQDTISSDDAADYIRVALDDYGIENLGDLIDDMLSGAFAVKILRVLPSVSATAAVTLQKYINDTAQTVSQNSENIKKLQNGKLDKITSVSGCRRAYIIDTDGTQKTVYISTTPALGTVPAFVGSGQINVANPYNNSHAANKSYVDMNDSLLASSIEMSLDRSNYVMTIRLKNTANSVLSTAEVDLPLESVILGGEYADGKLILNLIEGNSVEIDVSDIIDGLVNTTTHQASVTALNKRIDDANADHASFVQEIELSEIYAHAAYHAQEAESARTYTRGGELDRELRSIKKRLDSLETT